jgi:hypothetical protein
MPFDLIPKILSLVMVKMIWLTKQELVNQKQSQESKTKLK